MTGFGPMSALQTAAGWPTSEHEQSALLGQHQDPLAAGPLG